MQKPRAQARRVMRNKIKLYQALYDCKQGTLTDVEVELMAILETDPDVLAAIGRAHEQARRRVS